MESTALPYLEALKFLKGWSVTLLAIGTAVFLSLVIVCLLIENERMARIRTWLTASLTFWALSIVIALNVVGTIPWSTQRLPELAVKYHDIYQFPNYIGIPLWMLAFGQHMFFFLAILCLMVVIYIFNRGR